MITMQAMQVPGRFTDPSRLPPYHGRVIAAKPRGPERYRRSSNVMRDTKTPSLPSAFLLMVVFLVSGYGTVYN